MLLLLPGNKRYLSIYINHQQCSMQLSVTSVKPITDINDTLRGLLSFLGYYEPWGMTLMLLLTPWKHRNHQITH
jgi:hypothetical protein